MINHDYDRQNLGRNYSYHSHYRGCGGGGRQNKMIKHYNHNSNNNIHYWNKFPSRGGVGGGGGYNDRRCSASNMYKG